MVAPFQYFSLWLRKAGGLHQVGEPGSQCSSAAQVHQRCLIQQNSAAAWDTKEILQWKLNLSFALCIFCPCVEFVFFSFLPLQLSRQHLGVLWNKCYPLKSHCCLPERKMASYWKQYVMVIAVLLQVIPLKNVRDLFSSNWWWGKAQLKQKINCCIIFYSFKHHHTNSWSGVFIDVLTVASRTRNNAFQWCFCCLSVGVPNNSCLVSRLGAAMETLVLTRRAQLQPCE